MNTFWKWVGYVVIGAGLLIGAGIILSLATLLAGFIVYTLLPLIA